MGSCSVKSWKFFFVASLTIYVHFLAINIIDFEVSLMVTDYCSDPVVLVGRKKGQKDRSCPSKTGC